MRITDNSPVEKTFVERVPFWHEDGNNRVDADYADNGGYDGGATPAPASKEAYPPEEPPAATPVVGKTRLGSGLVKRVIGTGGMASVYLVWNERLEVYRAVKMLSRDAHYDRFETEIKISAKLRHPHIVEIYSVGEWNGLSYMEMEYIDGQNLQQIIETRGRFPEAACCAAAICIADALSYAHNLKFTICGSSFNGIIHRDLKPANIMFSKSGGVTLTDFGIARPAQAGLHTAEGNIVGTLHYLSPEQMSGQNVDHRSDIYSLGALIYEMATGVKTFPQETITELMRRRTANSFKKPSEYDFPITPALSEIIIKCLEADPDDRYQDADSLLDDLQKTLSSQTGLPPEKVISVFYPDADGAAALARLTDKPEIPPAAAPTPKNPPLTVTIPAKYLILAAPLMLLAMISTIMFAVMITSGSKNIGADTGVAAGGAAERLSVQNDTGDRVLSGSAQEILPVSTQETLQVSVPGTTRGSVQDSTRESAQKSILQGSTQESIQQSAQKSTQQPPVRPQRPSARQASADARSEDDLLAAAAASINRRDWVAAIRILEPDSAFTAKRGRRDLLLLEAYVEAKRLDRAQTKLDDAAKTGDALYFLLAGRYWFYRGNHSSAIEMLEASLTRSSALRNRNVIFGDAIYYIALVRSERLKSAPTDANRAAALNGWRRVESAYAATPGDPRLERARREITALN